MPGGKVYLIYSAFPSAEEAKKAGKILVEEGLCCCVNILTSYLSIYKWKGKMVAKGEFVLIAKAQGRKVKEAELKLKKIHPYEIPEIMRIKIEKANKEYEKWCSL